MCVLQLCLTKFMKTSGQTAAASGSGLGLWLDPEQARPGGGPMNALAIKTEVLHATFKAATAAAATTTTTTVATM